MKIRRIAAAILVTAGLGFAAAAPASAQNAAKTESGPAAEAAEEPAPPDPDHITWHAQALAHGPGGLNVTQFWSKGSQLRAETTIAGHKIVTIVSGPWYYAYDATKGLGIRVQRTPEGLALDQPYRRPFGNEATRLIEMGAEKIRDESFHGRKAAVYQLTDGRGRRTVWASQDALNIPLRIEIYNRRTGQTQATDYLDWLTGLSIPDTYFDVDPNVEITSYTFEEYGFFLSKTGSMGPVPVLYADLLQGHR